MMGDILPMDVNMIKIERKETEEDEEFGDEFVQMHALKSEYEGNEIETAEPDLTDEELEPPVPVTLPDPGVVILKEEVLQDPLVDIPDSWIYIDDETNLQEYNPQEFSQSSSFFNESSERSENEMNCIEESEFPTFSQESLERDHLYSDSQQQWIEEEKQKVELHIQAVRRGRKFRDTNVKRNVKTELIDTQNIELNMKIENPELCQMTDIPASESDHCVTMFPVITEIRSEPMGQSHVVLRTRRPDKNYGPNWDEWVREEKAKLEQHILEVRENRKRQQEQILEEAKTHRKGKLYNLSSPQAKSLPVKHSHDDQVRKTVTSTTKMELRVISKGRGRGTSKGRGRGITKGQGENTSKGRRRSPERPGRPTRRVSPRVRNSYKNC